MKTEDFDEAIRKKVECIDHKFTEKDIDKVVQHLGRNRVFKGKGISGSTMIYSLVAAAATSLLAWYLIKDNGNLPQSTKTPSSNSILATDSMPKVDTSEDTLTINYQATNKATISSDNSLKKPLIQVNQIKSGITESKTGIPDTTSAIITAITSEVESSRDETKAGEVAGDNTEVNQLLEDKLKTTAAGKLTGQSIDLKSNQGSDSLIVEIPGKSEDHIDGEELIKVEETPVSRNQQENIPIPQVESATPGTESSNKGGTGNKFFVFSDFMVGAGFELATRNLGVGVFGELSFAERLRFSAGIKYVSYQDEKFNSMEDFDRHNNRKINHRFEEHLKDNEHASEISIKSSLIQLPVAIRYSIPLNNNFSFLFSLGTDLDLILNQRLSYIQPPDSLGSPHDKLDARGDAVLFNNMEIAAGIEKQWKYLVLQAHPFIKPQLKQVFYKPKEFDFGLGVNIIYRF